MSLCLSFSEIVQGRDASVRITEDGLIYAIDLVMVVTGQQRDHAGKTLRNLSDEIFPSSKFIVESRPGKGYAKTKLLRLEDSIELIMVLPGKLSRNCRKTMADVITRYLDGDLNLIGEIADNKKMGKVNSYANFAQSVLEATVGQIEPPMPTSGWLYGTETKVFPGLIKVGRAMDVDARISSGNTFCRPAPHVVVAAVPTFDPVRDEKRAHAFFANEREEGEFFRTSKEAVQAYFDAHIMPVYQAELKQAINKL